MRSIPAALKEKLKNQFKVESTDSMAKLRVVATQTSVNSLLSEPIHEDIAPALGDVAVRQMAGDKELALAYALCLDDGIATMYMRKFPAGFDFKWERQFVFGAASDVALEFGGTWKMNAAEEWYYLETDEFPYIFFVRDGNLYVQYWRDDSTRALLATGVSQISACKGWQSSVDTPTVMPEQNPYSEDIPELPEIAAVTESPESGSTANVPYNANGILGHLIVGGNSVMVRDSIDEETLSKGPGWMKDSALPGADGMSVILGHRNRKHLKLIENVKVGDELSFRFVSDNHLVSYTVTDVQIFEKTADWTLPVTDENVLVLVTCYPFQYTGSAPGKFQVIARRTE